MVRTRLDPRTLVLCALLAALGVACGERAEKVHAQKQRLGALPKDRRPGTLAIDSDGRGWAIKAGPEGRRRLMRNGVDGEVLPDVSEPILAPETGRLLFWRLPDEPNPTGLLLVDGDTMVPTPIARPGQVIFSENGLHWAVAGGIGLGDPFAIDADGKPIPPKRGPVVVLHDGREVGRHVDTSSPVLDRSGAHIAYLAREDDGKVRLIVDGKATPPYEMAPGTKPPTIGERVVGPVMDDWYSVRFLSDGSLLSVSDHVDGWAIRRDDRVLATYAWATEAHPAGIQPTTPEGLAGRAAFIPSSIRVAKDVPVALWWERPPGDVVQWRVMRDGQPVDTQLCPRSWERERPAVTDDGRHVAYVCVEPEPAQEGDLVPREKMWVVHDGKRLGPYPLVWGVTLSPDGQHVVYSVSDGGSPQPRWRYHRDGVPFGPEFLETWPARFGPDGTHLAYEARGVDGTARLILDGMPIASYDEVVWGPTFVDPDRVAWVVSRDEQLWRVEAWVGDDTPA
jgi:hypothetical protein